MKTAPLSLCCEAGLCLSVCIYPCIYIRLTASQLCCKVIIIAVEVCALICHNVTFFGFRRQNYNFSLKPPNNLQDFLQCHVKIGK